MRSVDDIPMAIRSDVIMMSVVVKILDSIILSQGILLEEYFDCSVFSVKKWLFLLLILLCYKTFAKFGISRCSVILSIIFLYDI